MAPVFEVRITQVVDGGHGTLVPAATGDQVPLDALDGHMAKREAQEKFGHLLRKVPAAQEFQIEVGDPCLVLLRDGEEYAACEERRVGQVFGGGEFDWYLMT